MTARAHHLRYLALCAGMLLSLLGIAWAGGESAPLLWKSLSIAPFTFAGTFLLHHFLGCRDGSLERKKQLEAVPPAKEARFANLLYLATLAAGVLVVVVALLAPAYLPGVTWVVQALAGAAGIHAMALL